MPLAPTPSGSKNHNRSLLVPLKSRERRDFGTVMLFIAPKWVSQILRLKLASIAVVASGRCLDAPVEKQKAQSEYKSTPFLCRVSFKDGFIVSKPRDADWCDKVMTLFSRQDNSDNDMETEPPEPEPTPAKPKTPASKKQKRSTQYKDWTISSEGQPQAVVVKKVPLSHGPW